MWTRRDALRFALGLPSAVLLTGQWAFAAKDFWNTKPSGDWTQDEVEHLLTNSPWAKEVHASFNGEPGALGGGNRSGGMGSSRTRGGMSFPGGSVGFPGGGMGYPGGTNRGGGWPGGSGGGNAGGQHPENNEPTKATVRWETALPIQEALNSGSSGSSSRKPNPDFEKYYIIHVLGDIPAFGGRENRPGYGGNSDPNSRRDRRTEDDDIDIESRAEQERRLEMLKQYTKLERKDGPIFLERFERGSRTGDLGPGSYFYFSRLDGISMDDKEITFVTKMGPMEIKAKFALKDMVYRGKLTL